MRDNTLLVYFRENGTLGNKKRLEKWKGVDIPVLDKNSVSVQSHTE